MAGSRRSSGTTAFVQPDVISGSIIIWWGPLGTIPAGYALCDGTNGTPDLRDAFIVGAGGTYAVGATGGSATHSHTAYQAAHTHSHTGSDVLMEGTDYPENPSTITPDVTVNSSSNLPPFHAHYYIMKL